MPSSFIDRFAETVGQAIISPPQYVWWAGLAAVSAIMGRLVHTNTFVSGAHDRLYGNVFVLLVGPPGAGKTKAVTEARNLIRSLQVRVGPDDITGEKIYDILQVAHDEHLADNPEPGTMALFLDEFDSLMHSGMSAATKRLLCHCYDCREDPMVRDTYAHGQQELRDLCLTMSAGCTPAHLASAFAPMEWQEGLPSRLLMVYGTKPPYQAEYRRGSMETLALEAEELLKFVALTDHIPWQPTAMEDYKSWCQQNWTIAPPHPLLAGFGARRHLHLAKISFVHAAARLSPTISTEDFLSAVARLSDLEQGLVDCLALAGGNATKDIESFVRLWITAAGGEVNEWAVRQQLATRVSHYMVNAVLEELVASRVLVQSPGLARLAPLRLFRLGERI